MFSEATNSIRWMSLKYSKCISYCLVVLGNKINFLWVNYNAPYHADGEVVTILNIDNQGISVHENLLLNLGWRLSSEILKIYPIQFCYQPASFM